MSPHDTEALTQLTNEVIGLRADLRVFYTKLFGDEQAENPQGRIPRLESSVRDHNQRIKRIERWGWIAAGVAITINAIAAGAEFLYHLTGIKGH